MYFQILYETCNLKTYEIEADSKQKAIDKLYDAWCYAEMEDYFIDETEYDEDFDNSVVEIKEVEKIVNQQVGEVGNE